MNRLRRAPLLARLLLACYALALGVASAAPLMRAPQLEPLCSASGQALWQPAPDGTTTPPPSHTLECALCLPPLIMPALARPDPAPATAPAHCTGTHKPQRHLAPLARAAFPPRAPPDGRS